MRTTQNGLSTIQALLLLAVLGLGFTALFKIGPHYLDNSILKGTLESLGEQEGWQQRSNSRLNSDLQKLFTVNNIRDIKREAISINRDNGVVVLSVNYERRGNFMGNLDYVVVFNNSIGDDSSQWTNSPYSAYKRV